MSRERRFHVRDLLSPRNVLSPEEAHHLLRVLRLREGAEIALFDGKGRSARGVVEEIEGEQVTVQILGPSPSHESRLDLSVAVAVPKGDKMSQIVQMVTELGATRIVPLLTDRGEVDEARASRMLGRLRRISFESCKQSGRSLVPEVSPPRRLAEVLQEEHGAVLFAHPGEEALALEPPGGPRAIVVVGPEGGWSDDELELARSSGVQIIGLGPRTLRTETAAIVVVSLLQWLAGDLGE